MIVVNFFGGPCVGKSTLSAELFVRLKKMGLEAVLVGEYVKDCIESNKLEELDNELYIFAEQVRRLRRHDAAGVDVAICDWPLLNAVVYDSMNFPGEPEWFTDLVFNEFITYANLNYYILRSPEIEYSTAGRVHNAIDALVIDTKVEKMLKATSTKHTRINNASVELVMQAVLRKIVEEDND